MEDGIKEERDGCIPKDDLISLVTEEMTDSKERQRVQDHLQWCSLCQEEAREIGDFMNRDLSEEIAECYRHVDLAKIVVPKDFLEKLFPRKPSH